MTKKMYKALKDACKEIRSWSKEKFDEEMAKAKKGEWYQYLMNANNSYLSGINNLRDRHDRNNQ